MTDQSSASLLGHLARIQKSNPPADGDRRRERRFEVRAEADLYPMDRSSGSDRRVEVMLRDIGRCGVGLIAPCDLPLDSTWRMAVLHRQIVVAQQPILIRQCQSVDDASWRVSAQFCIESGMLCLLGVRPAAIKDAEPGSEDVPGDFLSPDDLVP